MVLLTAVYPPQPWLSPSSRNPSTFFPGIVSSTLLNPSSENLSFHPSAIVVFDLFAIPEPFLYYWPEIILALGSSLWILSISPTPSLIPHPRVLIAPWCTILILNYLCLWSIRILTYYFNPYSTLLDLGFGEPLIFGFSFEFAPSLGLEWLKLILVSLVLIGSLGLSPIMKRQPHSSDSLVLISTSISLFLVDCRNLLTIYLLVEASSFALLLALALDVRMSTSSLLRLFNYGFGGAVSSLFYLSGLLLLYSIVGDFDLRILAPLSICFSGEFDSNFLIGLALVGLLMLPYFFFKFAIPPFFDPSVQVATKIPVDRILLFSYLIKMPLFVPFLSYYSLVFELTALGCFSEFFQKFLFSPFIFCLFVSALNLSSLIKNSLPPNYFRILNSSEFLFYSSLLGLFPLIIIPIFGQLPSLHTSCLIYLSLGSVSQLPIFLVLLTLPSNYPVRSNFNLVVDRPLGRLTLFLALLVSTGFPPTPYFYAKLNLLNSVPADLIFSVPGLILVFSLFFVTCIQLMIFGAYFVGDPRPISYPRSGHDVNLINCGFSKFLVNSILFSIYLSFVFVISFFLVPFF